MAQARWEDIQASRGMGFAPVIDPTGMGIPTCSALRIRREPNSHDFINSRLWDNFHATPPTHVSSEDGAGKFMDMNPENSRNTTVKFRHQLDYMPTNQLPPRENSENPFLQRLDARGDDARNIVREFRDAVVEDNRELSLESSKKLTERQFQDRWIPTQLAEEAAVLQAYELLRPKQYTDSYVHMDSPATTVRAPASAPAPRIN
jgi:hypothetical protein